MFSCVCPPFATVANGSTLYRRRKLLSNATVDIEERVSEGVNYGSRRIYRRALELCRGSADEQHPWFDGIIKHRWTKEQIILGEVQHYLRVRTIRFSSATARSTLSQPR